MAGKHDIIYFFIFSIFITACPRAFGRTVFFHKVIYFGTKTNLHAETSFIFYNSSFKEKELAVKIYTGYLCCEAVIKSYRMFNNIRYINAFRT